MIRRKRRIIKEIDKKPIPKFDLIPTKGTFCFLCSWGNTAHDGIYAKDMLRLKNIYIEYRPRCSDEELANMLHLFFMEHIYDEKKNMPILDPMSAFAHIQNKGKTHTLNASEHVINSIKRFSRIQDILDKYIVKADLSGVDPINFTCMEKCQKILDNLYMRDVGKMSFIDPDCQIDTKKGQLFKLSIVDPKLEKTIRYSSTTKNHIQEQRSVNLRINNR